MKIVVKDVDRYGRTVSVVILPDGRNLNHEIVRAGFGWWFRRYAKNDEALERLEAEARQRSVDYGQTVLSRFHLGSSGRWTQGNKTEAAVHALSTSCNSAATSTDSSIRENMNPRLPR